jgi:glutamine synthetase
MSDLYYHGEPYKGDPRGVLRRVLRKAESQGFRFNLGIEPEFYVLREGEGGALSPVTRTPFKGPNACYDLALATESAAFLDPMVRYLNELGWGLFSYDQECGRGQYEFDFEYADAMTMADRFVLLRFMAKKVAHSIGAVATFMPKPFADDFRSGAHFNMSLADVKTGVNLFAPGEGRTSKLASRYGVKASDLALHFIAGIKRHARAVTAVTCPSYNSYQGLIAQGDLREFSWAPVLVAWGKNNRSAMLRLPGNRYCVENRAVDMSINPYLAAAISLAAGLAGVEGELDPGEPLNDDLYKRGPSDFKANGIEVLPRTLLHALEAFKDDPISQTAFGDAYKEIYLSHKLREWERSFYPVSSELRCAQLTFI